MNNLNIPSSVNLHGGLEADVSDSAKNFIPCNPGRYRPQEPRDLAERHEEHGTPVFRPQDDKLLATRMESYYPTDLEPAADDLSKRKELYGLVAAAIGLVSRTMEKCRRCSSR